MLGFPTTPLAMKASQQLEQWQNLVDTQPDFPRRVATAKSEFAIHNKVGNATFKAVKTTLRKIQGELFRCAYCEDSLADEIEHIHPKDNFPDKVFQWENYVYACGPCNGSKSNKFSVLLDSDGTEMDIAPLHPKRRPVGWVRNPPPEGSPLLIDPRAENPLDFLWLDLKGTFRIDPITELDSRMHRRAEYTRDILDLNRDFLIKARRNAAVSATSNLEKAADLKATGSGDGEIDACRLAIQTMAHRTVWSEMVRQRSFISKLDSLFAAIPEALSW